MTKDTKDLGGVSPTEGVAGPCSVPADAAPHAVPGNTDGAKSDVILAAIAYCASKWEFGARLLGNIQAIDISIAAQKGGEALRENEFMKTCGVIELAIRNPNVAAYIDHWEVRALGSELLQAKLLAALKKAYLELNEIHARDGVPWTHQGVEASVDHAYFSSVVDECRDAIAKAEGRQP